MLGAVAAGVLALIAAMFLIVFVHAWPSFSHNGYISWFFPGGDADEQLRAMQGSAPLAGHNGYFFRAWPLLWGTILTTGLAVIIGVVFSTLAAIFIVEFAPPALRDILDPVVRLLAGVPSVVYGLLGILVLAPWVENHLISQSRKESVAYVVQLTGMNLSVATIILTVMITPIMVALICEALASVPNAWREGAVALGVNPVRAVLAVTVRAARPPTPGNVRRAHDGRAAAGSERGV